jgi:hypothetical protein
VVDARRRFGPFRLVPAQWTQSRAIGYTAGVMLSSPRGSWLIAGLFALSLPGLPGCGKEKLTEIAAPESGVSLRYDLAAGQSYGGHIKMRNAAQTPLGDVITSCEFDVDLVVAGPLDGKSLLKATVAAIKVDVRLPEGFPSEAGGQVPPEAIAAVDGMELRFNLDERGDLTEMPEPPENAAPEVKLVVTMVSSALSAGFVKLPEQALKVGDSWDATPKDAPAGSTGTGKLDGMARHEAVGEDVAKLAYSIDIKAPEAKADAPPGPGMGARKQEVEALFSVAGYPVKIDRKISAEIRGVGGASIEVTAEWKKLGKRAVEPPTGPAGAGEVQAITDPCDPDYVGSVECVGEGGSPAPAEGADSGGDGSSVDAGG